MQVCVHVPGRGWGHYVQTHCEAPGPGWSAGLEGSAMGTTGMLGLGYRITARGSRPREDADRQMDGSEGPGGGGFMGPGPVTSTAGPRQQEKCPRGPNPR